MSESAEGLFCDYCGLPFPRVWSRRTRANGAVPSQPNFCCFGCRFASSVIGSRREDGSLNWALTRIGFAVFFTMNVLVFSMALWTQDWGSGEGAGPLAQTLFDLFRYVCLLFALPVLLLLGAPILENAWQMLRASGFMIDGLVVLGVGASFLYSATSVVRGSGPVYFEVGCMVLVLVTLGRWLDALGRQKATDAIATLERLLPENVRFIRDGREVAGSREDLRAGDAVRVLPGERFPCDGVLRRGAASVDEQLLTGECVPVVKQSGDAVCGGTLNLDAEVVVEVTRSEGESTLERLAAQVRDARRQKSRYELLADRVACVFLPFVVLIAVASATYHASRLGIEQGLLVGLAVLLIACPCALGIATPLAVWTAMGSAVRQGILFRNGEALERLASIRAVRIDKTGPLTEGEPRLTEIASDEPADDASIVAIAARLASGSAHPLCSAIRVYAEQAAPDERLDGAENLGPARLVPGLGVVADLPRRQVDSHARGEADEVNTTVSLGNVRFMQQSGLEFSERLQAFALRAVAQGNPLACIGWDRRVRAVFAFKERLRSEANRTIDRLQAAGLDVAVLTGDHAERGRAVQRELGIPVSAELVPEDKVAALAEARRGHGPVAMVGDGVNDAPALAAADIGIALGCGADVSRDVADVCLMSDDVRGIAEAIALARRTRRVIRQNLFWAFGYNTVGIGLAASGRLNPIVAALAMVLSSAAVVAGSRRLARGVEGERSGAYEEQRPAEPSVDSGRGLLGGERTRVPDRGKRRTPAIASNQ